MAFTLDLHNKSLRKLVGDMTDDGNVANTVKLFSDLQEADSMPAECIRRTLVALMLYLGSAEELLQVQSYLLLFKMLLFMRHPPNRLSMEILRIIGLNNTYIL